MEVFLNFQTNRLTILERYPGMQLVRHFRYAQFRPDKKRGVRSALSNNRITSHFEANTAKTICNNCFILL